MGLFPVQRKTVALMAEYHAGVSDPFYSRTFLQAIALTVFAHVDEDESLFHPSGKDMDVKM